MDESVTCIAALSQNWDIHVDKTGLLSLLGGLSIGNHPSIGKVADIPALEGPDRLAFTRVSGTKYNQSSLGTLQFSLYYPMYTPPFYPK